MVVLPFTDMTVDGWAWHIGDCGVCKVRGVPVATNAYYTDCANCLQKVVNELMTLGDGNSLKVGDTVLVQGVAIPEWFEMEISNVSHDFALAGTGMGTRVLRFSERGTTWKKKI
jgi:hypothetical protein